MSVIQKIFSRSFAYDYAEWSLGILPWALVSAFAAVALGTHASASHFLVDARVPESWGGALYLEDGLHRAVRAALRNRTVLHARVLDLEWLHPAAPSPPAG